MKNRFLILLILSPDSIAASDSGVEQDIRSYSILHGVSTAEAHQAIFLEANRDSALETIEKEFKGRIAGIYVENTPTYKIVVRVKGYGTNQKLNVAISNAKAKSDLPIEVQYGASETRDAAKGQIKKAQELVKQYFSNVQTTSYNEKTGSIEVTVKGSNVSENFNRIQNIKSEWKNPNTPLEINFVNWTIKPLVVDHVGAFVTKQDSKSASKKRAEASKFDNE